tara:strand:- start:395 stop:667 length:273 start_codon:yes stop_codon:yes gene_type:complete
MRKNIPTLTELVANINVTQPDEDILPISEEKSVEEIFYERLYEKLIKEGVIDEIDVNEILGIDFSKATPMGVFKKVAKTALGSTLGSFVG